jgi:CheY-like chemotaxis protein
VLIFDDSPFEGEALMMLCEGCSYIAEVVDTEEEATKILAAQQFDLVLVDYHQPAPFDCIEFLRKIATAGTAVALISADDKVECVYSFLCLPHLVGFFLKVLHFYSHWTYP